MSVGADKTILDYWLNNDVDNVVCVQSLPATHSMENGKDNDWLYFHGDVWIYFYLWEALKLLILTCWCT